MDHKELERLRAMLSGWRENNALDEGTAKMLWLLEALDDACDAEREAVMHTGRADATTRLMALALREGRLDVAEGIAEMVLDGHNPKVIAEMREAQHGRMALCGWPVEMLMRAMVEEIEAVGAKNYLEQGFTISGLGFALRIERVEGKSPATLVTEAVADAGRLRAALRKCAEVFHEGDVCGVCGGAWDDDGRKHFDGCAVGAALTEADR